MKRSLLHYMNYYDEAVLHDLDKVKVGEAVEFLNENIDPNDPFYVNPDFSMERREWVFYEKRK